MFTTTVCIVVSLFSCLAADKSEFAPDSCLRIPFTEISMFPFYGWGGFQIRLARRRAHPCDEQVVAAICSFCPYMYVKMRDSILWMGSPVETCLASAPDIADWVVHHEGRDQGVGMGRSGAAL